MAIDIKSYCASFWLWLVLVAVLLGIIGMESMRVLQLSDKTIEHAEEAGQRITFILATGETIPAGAAGTSKPQPDAHADEHTETEDTHHAQATAPHDDDTHHPTELPQTAHNDGHGEATEHIDTDSPILPDDNSVPLWEANKRPFWNPDNKPMIAIIISGLGLSDYTTQLALTLPGEATLAFSPYANDVPEWSEKARMLGHEILLNLPMEPRDYPISDPGPHAILAKDDDKKIGKELAWITSRTPHITGVLTPGSESLTDDEEITERLLTALKDHHLMVVIGRTDDTLIIRDVQNRAMAPLLLSTSRIDETITGDAIVEKLGEIEQRALTHGFAIAVAHPYPVTIEAIKQWVKTLEDKGILLAPATALMNAGNGE